MFVIFEHSATSARNRVERTGLRIDAIVNVCIIIIRQENGFVPLGRTMRKVFDRRLVERALLSILLQCDVHNPIPPPTSTKYTYWLYA